MKTFRNVLCSFLLSVLLIASLSVAALAAPAITFRGFSEGFAFTPGSEYTETDLFGSFKGVMPGDVLEETITFTNSAEDCDFVNLYLRAQPHDAQGNPLSTGVASAGETAESMAEFLSMLSMKVWNGDTLLFDAAPGEAGGLRENQLLGTFRTGETAVLRVELSVPAELDNAFAGRVGEVDWIFHVEAYNESQLSVRKVWSDGAAAHTEDSITINLLKDGEVAESQELNAENGWAYTFDRLIEGHDWSVEEANVPEGYTVSYETVGNTTTITNTKDAEPVRNSLDLTVKKVWSGDDAAKRPACVTVTLYNGSTVYDTVRLSASNDWTYTWNDPDADGDWQVTETNIPKGYTPSYRVSGDTVTITNTRTLIQTGQRFLPILLLGGAGVVLIAIGAVLLRKRKHA